MSNGVYVLPSAANGDVKPVVSSTPLVDFLMQLEDYTPTVGFLPEQGYWPAVMPILLHTTWISSVVFMYFPPILALVTYPLCPPKL